MMINMIENIKKVELHLHLDGSLDLEYIKSKYNLSDEIIKEKFIADDKCKNLNDYLTKFDYPLSIMQTKEELEDAIINLLNKLKSQNVIYVELRFAPQLHTKYLTQEEVVKIAIEAKNKVNIKSNLILCYMRGDKNNDLNLETLKVAKKYLGHGVCAVDLAGAEALFKTANFKNLFTKTKKLGIPFTIHAGEADGPESIKSAIEFGASRIGHGVRIVEDPSLLKYVIENKIPLEICPTSNIQTCVCDSYSNHPISDLYRLGVKTTINTDNMTVSNTSLENEYNILIKETKMTIDDMKVMINNSIDVSFISEIEKDELRKYI